MDRLHWGENSRCLFVSMTTLTCCVFFFMHAAKRAASNAACCHLSGYFWSLAVAPLSAWDKSHCDVNIKRRERGFIPCTEQIVPASSCDQDFSSFLASWHYCHCCAGLLLTELIYYQLVFLSWINQTHLWLMRLWKHRPTLVVRKHWVQSEFFNRGDYFILKNTLKTLLLGCFKSH